MKRIEYTVRFYDSDLEFLGALYVPDDYGAAHPGELSMGGYGPLTIAVELPKEFAPTLFMTKPFRSPEDGK